jgi:hypothetical protein
LKVYSGGSLIRELLGGIDLLALAVEVGLTQAVGVIIAAIGITIASKAILGVGATTVGGCADVVGVILARMWCESEGMGVGLPDIDLSAASALVTNASVGVGGGGNPSFVVALLS